MSADRSTMVDNTRALEFIKSTVSSDSQEVLKEEYERHICEPLYESAYFPFPIVPPPMPMLAHHRVQPSFVHILPAGMVYHGFRCTQPQCFITQQDIEFTANPAEDDGECVRESGTLYRSAEHVLSDTQIVLHNAPEENIVRTVHVPVPMPVQKTHVIQQPSPLALPPILTQEAEQRARASADHLAKSLGDMFESIATNIIGKIKDRRASQDRRIEEDYIERRGDYVKYRRPRGQYETRWRSKGYGENLRDDADNVPLARDGRAVRRRERNLNEREDDFLDDLDDDVSSNYGFRIRSIGRNEREDISDKLPHPLAWICRSLSNILNYEDHGRQKPCTRVHRAQQRSARITDLVKDMTKVAKDVMEVRRGIQSSGLRGDDIMQSMLAAEARLRKLIDLETQLAEELSDYRLYDLTNWDDDFLKELIEAEDKLRRLIEVEQKYAHKISMSRKTVPPHDKPGSSRPIIYKTMASKPPMRPPIHPERSMPANQPIHTAPDSSVIPSTPEIPSPSYRKMAFRTRPIPPTSLTELSPLSTLSEPPVEVESATLSQSFSSTSSSEVFAPGVTGDLLQPISNDFPSSGATQAESAPSSSEFKESTEGIRKKNNKQIKKSKQKSKSKESKKSKKKKTRGRK